MKVTVGNLYVGALIKADFLCSYREDKWHEVYEVKQQSNGVYLAVEGFAWKVFPNDYEVELKD